MTTRRTITITITEPQYDALAGMVARGMYDVECEMDEGGMTDARREHRLADRAWNAIAAAWHAKQQR